MERRIPSAAVWELFTLSAGYMLCLSKCVCVGARFCVDSPCLYGYQVCYRRPSERQ